MCHLVYRTTRGQPGAQVEHLPDALLATRWEITRARKAAPARTAAGRPGNALRACSAASRSAAELSVPPCQ